MSKLGLERESWHVGSEEGRPEVQGRPQTHVKLMAGTDVMDYMRFCFRKIKKPNQPNILLHTNTHTHTKNTKLDECKHSIQKGKQEGNTQRGILKVSCRQEIHRKSLLTLIPKSLYCQSLLFKVCHCFSQAYELKTAGNKDWILILNLAVFEGK